LVILLFMGSLSVVDETEGKDRGDA
jgi:hypothetical protein